MKCPNCSKEIRDGSAFCGFCGKPVAQPSKTVSTVPPSGPAQRQTPPRQSAPSQQRAPQPPMPPRQSAPQPPKKKRTGLIVTLCILAFLLIGAGVCGFLIYQGVIDVDIDSDSIFAFLRPADDDRDEDDEDEDDRRSSRRDKDDADEDEEDEDTDDRRGRDRDEDGKDEDDRSRDRDRDRDSEDEDGRSESAGGKTSGKVSAGADAGNTAAEEPDRATISYWYADKAVSVEDPERLWPDTGSKPFEGAAERLYWHTDYSLLVVTVKDTGGDIAAFTDYYIWDFRNNNTDLGSLLSKVVVITFDTGSQNCYMARYADAIYTYDLSGLAGRVDSYIAGGEYETAVVYLLKNATESVSSEYLLPNSATAYLTREDLLDLTWEECCFARNEIYARHGRIFSTPAIRAYFEGKSWYSGTIAGSTFDANVSNYLSAIERSNVNFIAEYERMTWGGSFY